MKTGLIPRNNAATCIGVLYNRPQAVPPVTQFNGQPYDYNKYWLVMEYPDTGKFISSLGAGPHHLDIIEEYRHLTLVE